jgi:hypothetical protein
VAIRLASDGPQTVRADTIGAAWLAVAGRILTEGVDSRYDGMPVREISLVTLVVDHPGPADEIIATHADPERLAWMHANFTEHAAVAALGDADSYATRLFDYEHSGRDQVAWVVDRLRRNPATRSAAITTFQPHTDTSYIPCVIGARVRERARLPAGRPGGVPLAGSVNRAGGARRGRPPWPGGGPPSGPGRGPAAGPGRWWRRPSGSRRGA